MKKKGIMTAVIMGILLLGCSSNNETAKNDSINTFPNHEQGASENISAPPSLQITNNGVSTAAILDKWCWQKSNDPCAITPDSPDSILQGTPPLRINQGDMITLSWNSSEASPDLRIFDADIIELVQVHLNEKETVQVNDNQFSAPSKKGKFYYSLTLKWTKDLKGEASYAFHVVVE